MDKSNLTDYSNISYNTIWVEHKLATKLSLQDISLAVCIILSSLLNGLILVAFCKSRKLSHLRDKLLMSLTSADLSRAISGFIPLVKGLMIGAPVKYGPVCQITGYVITALALTSISHLVALSLVQVFTISSPYQTSAISEKRLSRLFLFAAIWLYGLMWATFPLLGWNGYAPENDRKCSINWGDNSTSGKSYVVMLFLFCFVLPIITMTASFSKLQKELRFMTKRAVEVFGSRHHATISSQLAETKHTKLVMIMVLSFGVAWMPYAVTSFIIACGFSMPKNLIFISGLCGKLSSISNPIIYVLVNKKYRRTVLNLVRRHKM